MSGQLVGEVIAAAAELKSRGLSERGFHALIAIAEKCHAETRQASIPWSHIRDGLYGASLSTAKRAIADLKRAEALRVVKRGFDNHAGRIAAPIYEILELSDDDTQVSASPEPTGHPSEPFGRRGERVTQVTQSLGGERVKPGGRTGQIGERTGHPGDLLNGSTNGSTNGESARKREATEPLDVAAVPQPGNVLSQISSPAKGNGGHASRADLDDPNFGLGRRPPDHCSKNPIDGCPDPCHACGAGKRWDADYAAAKSAADKAAAERRRQNIANCELCDEFGWLITDPNHRDESARRCGHRQAVA